MTALPLEAPHSRREYPEPTPQCCEDPPAKACVTATQESSQTCTLNLSRSRTQDAALEILKVYKLSGNFYFDLEVVLGAMGFRDMVTYEVEPHRTLNFSDCCQVVYEAADGVPPDRFDAIIRSIKDRIGFDAPWWETLLHWVHPGSQPAGVCRASTRH